MNSYPDYGGDNKNFLMGLDGANDIISEVTERHLITIAGAGSGKGVGVIMPNLFWLSHNALVIDPKGEAAEITAQARADKGQNVYVIDPFQSADIDDKFRASLNPLDALDVDSLTILEDIQVLADGIVMRGHDQSSSHWDDGAQTVIAGLIGFVLLKAKPEDRNLIEVRNILRDLELFKVVMHDCKTITECSGVCQAGAARAFAKEGEYFVSNADKNTAWLDSKAMVNTLSTSSFSMSELKTGNATVFLVLPANYLGQHGRFLRLFTRHALEEMARKTPAGKLRDKQCVFILDEFFSLGYIDEIAKAAGLMRGYGLQLWPILQDLGQLIQLYGREGSETFFGNADVHMFFGNTDQLTLEHMSKLSGTVTLDEIGLPPVMPTAVAAMGGGQSIVGSMAAHSKDGGVRAAGAAFGAIAGGITASIGKAQQAEYQNKVNQYQDKMNEYQQRLSRADRPRLSVEEMAIKVKKQSDVVADNMFVVTNGSNKNFYKPLPYFRAEQHFKNAVVEQKKVANSGFQAIDWFMTIVAWAILFVPVTAPFLNVILGIMGDLDLPEWVSGLSIPIYFVGSVILFGYVWKHKIRPVIPMFN